MPARPATSQWSSCRRLSSVLQYKTDKINCAVGDKAKVTFKCLCFVEAFIETGLNIARCHSLLVAKNSSSAGPFPGHFLIGSQCKRAIAKRTNKTIRHQVKRKISTFKLKYYIVQGNVLLYQNLYLDKDCVPHILVPGKCFWWTYLTTFFDILFVSFAIPQTEGLGR